MSTNLNLTLARMAKKDEFYTQLSDIEAELPYYKKYFHDKTVYCNCDDPKRSNFFKYFSDHFDELGLRKLIATHFVCCDLFSNHEENPPCKTIIENGHLYHELLRGNGDFRSEECVELLKEADIVVTNPPFSLFRDFIALLMKHQKKFLIIGNINFIVCKEIFPLFKENKIWLGYKNGNMAFTVPDYYEDRSTRYWKDENGQKWRSMGNIAWFTNLDISKRHEKLVLYKKYNPAEYPRYDNYDAINVGKTADIPCDYDGVMGVPISFLDKYNPEQFEILDDSRYHDGREEADDINVVDGRLLYRRILIRKKFSQFNQ